MSGHASPRCLGATLCRSVAAWASAVALLLVSRGAAAREPGTVCADPRVRVEGVLEPRWLEPVVRVCEELGSMKDVDASARLRIVPAEDGIIAEASLGDGRVALRQVHAPADLRLTVEALMTLPPTDLSAPPSRDERGTVKREERHPAARAARSLAVELGAALVGRLSRAPTYLAAGGAVHAGIRPGDWLLALSARWDPAESLAQGDPLGFEMSDVGVGFCVARRLVRGSAVGVDIGATANLLVQTQSLQEGDQETTGSQSDVRLGLLGRVLVGDGAWRFAPQAEIDVAPGRLSRNPAIDPALPTLPTWSVSAGLGVIWEEP